LSDCSNFVAWLQLFDVDEKIKLVLQAVAAAPKQYGCAMHRAGAPRGWPEPMRQ